MWLRSNLIHVHRQVSVNFFFLNIIYIYIKRKMCMGSEADGKEEKHHMKLTEKTEGSICCDMKAITLKKSKGKCWLKVALNDKL